MQAIKNKAIFLDRDGVIIKDKGYVYKFQDVVWLNGVFTGIKYAKKLGYLIIVITNQSGIGRRFFKTSEMKKLHSDINAKIYSKTGFEIDKFYYCPYHSVHGVGKYKKKSFNRKPNPGMLIKAIKKYKININNSIMIGDKIIDKIAAKKMKIRFFYRRKGSLYVQLKKIINE